MKNIKKALEHIVCARVKCSWVIYGLFSLKYLLARFKQTRYAISMCFPKQNKWSLPSFIFYCCYLILLCISIPLSCSAASPHQRCSAFYSWEMVTVGWPADHLAPSLSYSASLVDSVPDGLLCLQAAVVVAQLNFVEGLRLVKSEAVKCAHLIGMGCRFCSPGGAVPELAACWVSTNQLVAGMGNLKFVMLIEILLSAAVTPVRAVMRNEGALEALAEGCITVVQRLVVWSSSQLGACTVTARVSVKLYINWATLVSCVEAGGGEFVFSIVNDLLLEDFAGLLSLGLTQVVVVHANARHVTLVSREDGWLSIDGGL